MHNVFQLYIHELFNKYWKPRNEVGFSPSPFRLPAQGWRVKYVALFWYMQESSWFFGQESLKINVLDYGMFLVIIIYFRFALTGFEIPTYLLAKCKPKLENASWNFKHLLKNANANYWRTVTKCTKFHMGIQKKAILFVLDKHQSCITENTLRRLWTILHVAIEASELSFVIRILWVKCVRLHSQSILRFCVFCTEKQ